MKRLLIAFTTIGAVAAAAAAAVAAFTRRRRAGLREADLQQDLARFEGEGGATAP